MKFAPQPFVEASSEKNMGVGLLKSVLFTGSFCGATFVGATIWQYESVRQALQKNSWKTWTKNSLENLQGWQHKEGEFRQAINSWWNELNDGQKVFWPICLVNGIVFACWHHPGLQSTMFRYFCSNPAARAVCWPMFFSTFSHFAFIHFGLNMYVLHSFSSGVGRCLGKEQFLAMYLSGGVVSSLASHAFKVARRCPGPSLGASGAIMALLGYFCTVYPDAQLGIVFIPGLNFSADSAIKAIMCLDAAGMAMGWRMFDHAAHLGGALFGLFYAHFGAEYIWANTEPVMKKWHQLRTDVSEILVQDSKKGDE
ncbi:Presenilins-associated rhomboid-like protein, mitochondrial [Chionoecetes opilio]|uniref:rhomboid protease n=1 Tax=Chionoecetes opilio TaxID=41210 RepID=A0A8J4XKR9_CHIOP|nr:Presenilins-associated rhomboid-like protein, mitochondrial [Chionoecetes opilio]